MNANAGTLGWQDYLLASLAEKKKNRKPFGERVGLVADGISAVGRNLIGRPIKAIGRAFTWPVRAAVGGVAWYFEKVQPVVDKIDDLRVKKAQFEKFQQLVHEQGLPPELAVLAVDQNPYFRNYAARMVDLYQQNPEAYNQQSMNNPLAAAMIQNLVYGRQQRREGQENEFSTSGLLTAILMDRVMGGGLLGGQQRGRQSYQTQQSQQGQRFSARDFLEYTRGQNQASRIPPVINRQQGIGVPPFVDTQGRTPPVINEQSSYYG